MDENKIVSIVQAEIQNCLGQDGDELSLERSKCLDYYKGDMDEYLPVSEGRVDTVSMDVEDTVESILPSLLKIFTDRTNIVEFAAVSPEDEAQAKQETDVIRHIFWEKNDGYLNLYSFFKDALIQKNGILKIYWEEDEYEREEYKGVDELELTALLNDETRDTEIMDYSVNDDMTIDVVIKTKSKDGQVKIVPVPPEEFGINKNATSPDPRDATFCYHKTTKTVSDLVEAGYDREKIEALTTAEDDYTTEQYNRNQYLDGTNDADVNNPAMKTLTVVEAYGYIDTNDDGIAELHKITLASGSDPTSQATLLDMEEVDEIPFVSATAIINTHMWAGMSLSELVMELQDQKTILTRSIIDNTIRANNMRTAVNEAVNIKDLLVNRPDGIVRTEGEAPPSQHIMPFPTTPVPQQAYALMEMLTDSVKQRTGIGDEVQGLDTSALSNINTGVIMAALEQSRMRVETIARNFAELGVKPMFRSIHALMRKHAKAGKAMAIKLDNQWVQVSPAEWRERTNLNVMIGIGKDSKEKKLAMYDSLLQKQMSMLQTGMPITTPNNIYSTLTKITDLMGLDATQAWMDPQQAPPPQPPPPDPQVMAIQSQDQYNQARIQLEQQKLQLDAQMKQLELQAKQEIETIKAQAGIRKSEIDEQNQIMNAESDAAKAILDARLEQQKQEYQKALDEMKLDLEKYKADLAALTKLNSQVLDRELANELHRDVVEGGNDLENDELE